MAGPSRPGAVYLDADVWIDWFDGGTREPPVHRIMEWVDSKHLLTVFMTGDTDFPVGQTIEGVHVRHPYLLGDPDRFDVTP